MRLLVIGDLHYAQPRAHAPATWTAARDTFYTAFMRTIHAIQADYVVALGDATQHGFVTEWEQMTVAYNVTSRPIRYILGNHDTMHVPKCTLVAVSGQPRPYCRKRRAHGCSFWTRHTEEHAFFFKIFV